MMARYPMEFFHDVIVYTLIVSLLHLFDRQVRAAQLEAQLAHARLENLRLQLQPHFLFNALNTISAVVYEDPRKADAMIAGLSDLLRRTITDSDAQLVPLAREIETLELYLNIMRRRFEDKLRVDMRIDPDVQNALVPHLLLQPLVENSIRHGADPRSHAVNVTLLAEREGSNIHVRIRDRGRGLPDGEVRRGTGLSNTAERLEQLYGREHRLAFENCDGRRPAGLGAGPVPDMIRVLIVDDEPPARRKVRRGLERDADIGEIREAGSGEEAIAALRDFAPDLVFLDVQMPDIDGFGVLAAAPEPRTFHVVFLTAHEHHALHAFEAEALDYLLKPVDPERFDRALDRAKEQVRLRRARTTADETRPFLKRLLVQKQREGDLSSS